MDALLGNWPNLHYRCDEMISFWQGEVEGATSVKPYQRKSSASVAEAKHNRSFDEPPVASGVGSLVWIFRDTQLSGIRSNP
jgi:hypothetical protein